MQIVDTCSALRVKYPSDPVFIGSENNRRMEKRLSQRVQYQNTNTCELCCATSMKMLDLSNRIVPELIKQITTENTCC